MLSGLASKLDLCRELTSLLQNALEDSPPATLREGGIIKESYHKEVAELRSLSRDAKGAIAAIEAREKERTGISSLKIKYSKVFGYTIEITRSHLTKVPESYIRKQTIANGERYITEELKKFEEKIITADYRLKALEESLFAELRGKVAARASVLLANSRILADIDVLLAFARVARERGYVRPAMSDSGDIEIEDGRHPVIESLLPQGQFVPNSFSLA